LSDPVKNFAFYVGAIEDAVVAVLKTAVGSYADVDTYSGELDNGPKLREALNALSPRFPIFLVTYTEGKSTRETQIEPGEGAPWSVRHDCVFLVIVADDDARGETERRRGAAGGTRGAYNMASDVLGALENRQFAYVPESGAKIILTPGEFVSTGIEHIASYPEVTAYAVPFQTYFTYLTPDRRRPAQPIDSIIFDLNPLDEHPRALGAPGVTVSIKE
jgi:phage gp37-like protein